MTHIISPKETIDQIKTSRKGFGFGVTSGVITTLGLIIGLTFSTNYRPAVIAGIITIAIADALSDAFGIHISEEYSGMKTKISIWTTTISTAFYKFIFAITFLVPVLFLNLGLAVLVSVFWGMFLISFLSFKIAKKQRIPVWKPITEHIVISIIVIIVTYIIGKWVGGFFI